jgi:hypothetical protein
MKKILSLFTMVILFGILNAQSEPSISITNPEIPKVVISGVYGGGGNSGATYKNDYIELYNTTGAPINLTGYSLYYSPVTGGTNNSVTKKNTYTFPANSSIEANGFVLIKASAGSGSQPNWPVAFDFDGSGDGTNLSMAAAAGRVLLLSKYVDLSPANSVPTTLAGIQAMDGYMDYMPYGKLVEPPFGGTTIDLAANKAAQRKYNGSAITYTFSVGAVFSIITADENAPRNSDYGNANRVKTPTFSPAGGSFSDPITVTISCTTAGATIRYTLDGSEPDLSSDEYSSPITISETTTIKAKASKEDMDDSKVGSATYYYPQPVSSLATLRTLAPPYTGAPNEGTTIYTYTGKAVVTHKQSTTNFNTIYIQDGTAAIMIYDKKILEPEPLELGDLITNVSGTLNNYYGMIEFIPIDPCEVDAIGCQVNTTAISVSQLDANHQNPIQAKVISTEAEYVVSGNFVKDTYYALKQNNVVYDSVVYTDNWGADYITKPIPAGITKIYGVCNFKQNQNRIIPLNINNHVAKITDINKSAIKLSPNPANNFVNIATVSPMKLEVFTLLGNLIATEHLTEGQNTISVSGYPAGVYFMKLTDVNNGRTTTQKLVVK